MDLPKNATERRTLEQEINVTNELAYQFDNLAFGVKPEGVNDKPVAAGEINRLINSLSDANARLRSALNELSLVSSRL